MFFLYNPHLPVHCIFGTRGLVTCYIGNLELGSKYIGNWRMRVRDESWKLVVIRYLKMILIL